MTAIEKPETQLARIEGLFGEAGDRLTELLNEHGIVGDDGAARVDDGLDAIDEAIGMLRGLWRAGEDRA